MLTAVRRPRLGLNTDTNANGNGNNNNLVSNNNNLVSNNPARAVGKEEYLTDEQLASAAFTDDEIAAAFGTDDTTFIDELPSLAIDAEAAAFAEDDSDSSDFAIQADSGTFEEVPYFAIEESGDFAAIEEEATAFALEENLEAAAVGENLQFFNENDAVSMAVEDPFNAVGDTDQFFTENDVVASAVAEDVTATIQEQLPTADLAVAEDVTAATVQEQLPTADLAVTDPLATNLAVDQPVEFPVSDQPPGEANLGDFALADTVDVENLALDDPDAAHQAVASNPTTLTKTSSTPLPSWGIALIVIGVFIAIACILVVIQLFIYFRSA